MGDAKRRPPLDKTIPDDGPNRGLHPFRARGNSKAFLPREWEAVQSLLLEYSPVMLRAVVRRPEDENEFLAFLLDNDRSSVLSLLIMRSIKQKNTTPRAPQCGHVSVAACQEHSHPVHPAPAASPQL